MGAWVGRSGPSWLTSDPGNQISDGHYRGEGEGRNMAKMRRRDSRGGGGGETDRMGHLLSLFLARVYVRRASKRESSFSICSLSFSSGDLRMRLLLRKSKCAFDPLSPPLSASIVHWLLVPLSPSGHSFTRGGKGGEGGGKEALLIAPAHAR